MARFSQRHGHRRAPLPRTTAEEAPDDLRVVLLSILVEDQGYLGAYRTLIEAAHRLPDPNVWSNDWAKPHVYQLIDQLDWFAVFDLLEEQAVTAHEITQVNESFARTGLAYEMDGTRSGSEIRFYDPEGDELGVTALEDEALEVLVGEFAPVREQHERALTALRARPAEDEKAISESIGALEAVVRVLAGGQNFGQNVNKLFENEPPWAKALAKSLTALYGYSSQVPGARHGRYTDPVLTHEEALYVARTCGSASAYLVAGDRTGRWPARQK